MRNIIKGIAVVAALRYLARKKKNKSESRRERDTNNGLWRRTPPNPDSASPYGDLR
jgi:hypothetical protein